MLLYLFRYSNTALLVCVGVCVCVLVHQVGGTFGGRGVVVSIHLLAQICIYIYFFFCDCCNFFVFVSAVTPIWKC